MHTHREDLVDTKERARERETGTAGQEMLGRSYHCDWPGQEVASVAAYRIKKNPTGQWEQVELFFTGAKDQS